MTYRPRCQLCGADMRVRVLDGGWGAGCSVAFVVIAVAALGGFAVFASNVGIPLFAVPLVGVGLLVFPLIGMATRKTGWECRRCRAVVPRGS